MAKLVRARPKLPEFLPEWAQCCPEGIVRLRGEYVVDISQMLIAPAGLDACPSCGRDVPSVKIVKSLCGCWLPIDLLDLDEGTFAAAEQP